MQLSADVILDPNGVLNEAMKARERYLGMLTHPITQGKGTDTRWSTRVPDKTKKDGRRLIRKATREEVENAVILFFMEQEQKVSSSNMTIEDCWQLWYDFKASHNRSLKTTSLKMFRSDRKRFLDGTTFSKRKISSLSEFDIEDYLVEQAERYHMTQKRVCQLAGYVKGIFFVAYRNHIIDSNPWDRVSLREVVYPACYKPKCQPDEERILSDIQMHRVKKAVEAHLALEPSYLPDYAILIAQYTGMRAGELAALEWTDIRDGCIHVTKSVRRVITSDGQTTEIGDTKNHKDRAIPIGQKLSVILDQLKAAQADMGIDSPYILDNGKLPTPNTLGKAAKRRGIEAGIDGPLTIHRIRRTVASRLNAIYDRATVSHIMGHTEEVDARHYDYDTAQLADKQQTMDKLYA
ncbi:putative uncharacterized protein [Firmicutes bacterium CAG:791]|nr:putative uncharacterized protein [Firmicutes bacterium CAG:791]